MGRQLFLHHYLPAHLASSLVTGALLEFIFNADPVDLNETQQSYSLGGKRAQAKKVDGVGWEPEPRNVKSKQSLAVQTSLVLWGAAGVVMAVVIGGWWFFLPLTYGKPGLSPEQVVARKWLGYDLHFAK